MRLCVGRLAVTLVIPAVTWGTDTRLDRLRNCLERSDIVCASAALSDIEKRPSAAARDSLDYLELAAHARMLQGNQQEALALIEEALRRKPNEFRYLLIQGRVQQQLGAHPSAIQSFLLAQKVQPASPEVYYLIGMSFFMEEEYDRAARHFSHVLQLDASNDKALFMLGVLHAYRSELDKARGRFAQAVALQPRNAHYRLHYAVLLDRDGKSSEALTEIERTLELDPQNAFAQYHAGRLYGDRGELELARKHLELAATLRPSLPQTHYRLSVLYRQLGLEDQSRQALAEFQKAKARQQKDPVPGPDALLVESAAK